MKFKKRKILFGSLILAFLIPLVFIASTASVYFQTIYFTKITEALSKEMGGKIVFKDMYLSIFSGIIINDLYIEDKEQDTLLFAKHVEINLKDYDISELKFNINSVTLENAYYNLYSINKHEKTNMQYIIDYFNPEENTDSTKLVFILNANNINSALTVHTPIDCFHIFPCFYATPLPSQRDPDDLTLLVPAHSSQNQRSCSRHMPVHSGYSHLQVDLNVLGH